MDNLDSTSHERAPRSRRVDDSNVRARDAIAATLARFPAWRDDLTRFSARLERGRAGAERGAMLERCAGIERELMAARTELIVGLADTPARVSGHSRVVDVEKALDEVAARLDAVRRALGG